MSSGGEPVPCRSATARAVVGRRAVRRPATLREHTVDVTLGSLDDPGRAVPTCEIWLSDRVAWEAVDGARAHHA